MANDTTTAVAAARTIGPANPVPPVAEDVAALVERVLHDFVSVEAASLAALDPALEPLANAARAAVLDGGKRIRPTFAYWGWRGVVGGHEPVGPVLPALAALELLHAFALVHDDVMDRSPTRRGRPTAHRALAAAHSDQDLRGDADRFGDSGAILVGDLCLVWADQLMTLAGVSSGRLRSARRGYDRMRVEAIAGQFLDLAGEASRGWTVERALLTAMLKTASYTVTRPLLYGAALAGVSGSGASPGNRLAEAYRRYGSAVGEAFQLRDDLLDLYGDPAVTGKPVGADITNGRPTVLLQLARALAGGSQRTELARLLAGGPQADLDRLAALIRQTGATARVQRMITQRVVDAIAALDRAPVVPEARAGLAELATVAAFRTT